ncbi:MAG: Uma2 family endonuclease [Acidobacteria bacterium]|nr:Uma2 family endonuclease [Acidobacteriota bacterium]
MATAVAHHRFSVDDLYRMLEAGILSEDDRVELIRGEIVDMTPIGSLHAMTVDRLNREISGAIFRAGLEASLLLRVQNPVRLAEDSEPEPDLALLKAGDYSRAHPGPHDVLLIVEVADTSVDSDRRVKIPLYAESRIGEIWLVDLTVGCVEVYRGATPEGYQPVSRVSRGQSVSCAAVPQVIISVDKILGS